MRKIVSVAVFAAMLLSCVSSFAIPVSAAELSDDDAYRYFDSLRTTIAYYGLDASSSTGEQDICYYYGVCVNGNYNVSCLWIGYHVYRSIYDLSTGEYNYYDGNYVCDYYPSSLGHPYVTEFYYNATNDQVQLLAGQTNNLQISDKLNQYTDAVTFSELDTLDDLLAAVEPQEPTEAPVATAPPFTLPDDWINGGETLPEATEVTYPSGFDPDDAFNQFTDITLEVSDDVQGGIGFFWEVLIRYINALSLMPLVFFSLVFVLITWFLKG